MNVPLLVLLFAVTYVQSAEVGDVARARCKTSRDVGADSGKINDEYAHMVLLNNDPKNKDKYICGGVLVSHSFVLTTANCVKNSQGDVKLVFIGDPHSKNKGDFEEYKVAETFIYPSFKRDSYYDDLALIKLDRLAVVSANVYSACLQPNEQKDSTLFIGAGWGLKRNKELNRKMELFKEVDSGTCNKLYQNNGKNDPKINWGIDPKKMICAKNDIGDPCFIESGSPIQIKNPQHKSGFTVVGLLSFGKACNSKDPAVFIRVSNYIGWIESIVWPN